MYKFDKKQDVYKIGGVKIGGSPGENCTFMIGSMFYTGHKKVLEKSSDREKGIFNKTKAETLINNLETISDNTGIPAGLDLVANYTEEAINYVDFVTSITDMPFTTDIWNVKPKLGAAEYISEQNLGDQHIYNSLAPWSTDIEGEIAKLNELSLKNVLLVAFDAADPSIDGKIKILEESLLPWAKQAGFKQFLVDTSLMSLPASAFAFLAGKLVKENFGLPVGCAPSNGSDMVKKKTERVFQKNGFRALDSAVHALGPFFWQDFLLFGPIESASWLFPSVATANAMLPALVYDEGGKLPKDSNHPLNKFYGDFIDTLTGTKEIKGDMKPPKE
jgi:tetrahydromethanopterin S-methyltransferase subunit H|tara:strand:+ start:4821 stop:5816 length:996 start_codon:yes stop_codon:yes gene_type:complete